MTKVIEVDCTTGESVERDMTPEELNRIQEAQVQFEAELLAREQEEARLAANKQSAQAKLAALGLTPEEIAAIIS